MGVQLIVGIINNGLGESVTDIVLSIILLILYFVATFLILKVFVRLEHNKQLDLDLFLLLWKNHIYQ